MDNYFKISQIASFFGVTTVTLRYYEQYGLLTPAYVDAHTKYRYYNMDSVYRISYIMGLRNVGMNMAQVKSYLEGKISLSDHISQLIRQRAYIDKLIKATQALYAEDNNYNVEFTVIPSGYYVKKDVCAADTQGLYDAFTAFLTDNVKNSVIDGLAVSFMEFRSLTPQYTDITVTAGFRCANKDSGQFYPEARAIATFHRGSYDTLSCAYDALVDFAQKNKLALKGTAVEYYYESFTLRANPESYITEVFLLLD